MEKKWLCYGEDWRSLLFTGITLALLLFPVYAAINTWMIFPWIVISTLFCFSACIINHNHVHHPVFINETGNRIFSILLSLARGHTSFGVIVAHNYNHHRHNGNEKDWISTRLAGEGNGFVRLLRYIIMATISMAKGRNKPDAPELPAGMEKQLRIQRFFLLAFIVLVGVSGTWKALFFVGLPWLLSVAMLVGVNLLQHDYCDPESELNHSRNFLSFTGNWFFFNNGYHAIHHLQPELHWSRLPESHMSLVAGQAKPVLQCRSIIGFLLTYYVFSTDQTQLKLSMAGSS